MKRRVSFEIIRALLKMYLGIIEHIVVQLFVLRSLFIYLIYLTWRWNLTLCENLAASELFRNCFMIS